MATSVRLRPLTRTERRLLRTKLRDLSLAARIHQRYRLINEVRQGRTIVDAADRVGLHFTAAYDWVHRFNDAGFASFEQVPNPKGRPPILKATQLRSWWTSPYRAPPSAACLSPTGPSPSWPNTCSAT